MNPSHITSPCARNADFRQLTAGMPFPIAIYPYLALYSFSQSPKQWHRHYETSHRFQPFPSRLLDWLDRNKCSYHQQSNQIFEYLVRRHRDHQYKQLDQACHTSHQHHPPHRHRSHIPHHTHLTGIRTEKHWRQCIPYEQRLRDGRNGVASEEYRGKYALTVRDMGTELVHL